MEEHVVTSCCNSMPRIGDKAPSFKAVTTQGEINFPEDYAGSWPEFVKAFCKLLKSLSVGQKF
ncbi:MAG: hypothetical protein ACP5TY_13065, partial [Thermodesulforhabdaceae bacterium]